MRKLTKQEIQFIDQFLVKKSIKYIDVRSELLDHLATEFEEKSNYVLIEDYLATKGGFIIDFAKKKQKSIHWSYQKKLWVQFAKFFYKPKFLLASLLLIILGYGILQFVTLKVFSFACFFTLAALILYPIYYQIKYSKAIKNVQSMQSLFSVTALPSLFLYTFNLVNDLLFNNYIWLIIYFTFSILLGLAAVIIIENDRKKILKRYNELVS
jgi:hypothetical protein